MDPYGLKSVSDLPAPFRSFFSFRYFNSLQSECFSSCFLSDVNMVISAPTGSGKTVLFELCILRLLSRFFSAEGNFHHAKGTLKTIYIAPSKALVQEKLRDWNQKLGSWGINCLELTGDNESYNIRNIQEADIIVTTPEKFDAVTRYRVKDGGLSFFSDIALLLIDEVHLLNDPRGAALEAIVSRIKMLARNPEMKSTTLACVRFLAVSATIPNICDLAEWLTVPIHGIKRFGEEMRPVKLTTRVFDLLMQYSRGKSALIFCSTRKGAQEAAQRLSQAAMTFGHSNPFIKDREQQERLREASLSCSDKQMQSYILYGIGFHNGGLCLKDRNLIEGLFLKGDLQMSGRAGRPPFDDTGMNPENYAIKKGIPGDRIEKHMQEICVQKVNELSRNQMIWTDEDGFLLKPLEPGRLMTKYYLRFNTMKNIMQAHADCSMEDALHIVCRAEEVSWIQLRRNEKKLLSDTNTDKDGKLRFHILGEKGKRKKRIQTREEKIFVLANDCLTGDPSLHDLSMNQDMNSICSNGCRIAKCMKEYFIFRKNYKGALNSALLAKSLHQKLWDDSPYLLKQLPGIGMVTAKALHSMGVKSFATLREADPRKIEIVTGRKYPFGNHIKEALLSLPPQIELKLEETQCQRQGNSMVVVTLTRLSESAQSTKRHYADMVVAVEEDNLILFHEKIRVDEFSSPYSATILVSNPQQEKLTAKADLIFEDFIGIDLHENYTLKKVIDSNVIPKYGKKHLSCFPQPKDVCVIEDDNDYTSCAPTEQLHNSKKCSRECDLMPNFNLLGEEDLEEEGRPSFETEESECRILTPRTVFDHIREKAKSFPSLATSGNAFSPSSEALLRIRKQTREKQLEHSNGIEVTRETESNKVQHSSGLITSSDQREERRSDIGKAPPSNPSKSFETIYAVNCRGEVPPVSEENSSKTSTEEKIFDHIRKKAKNFPLVNKLESVESEAFIRAKELFWKNHLESRSAAFDLLEPKVSNQTSCIGFSSESSTESTGKQQYSPSISRRQCCSEATVSKTGEVDSFLGFKSVFSFL
ncbi:hypothetical protein RHMOL_Rhmol08G0061800 [Rhododendron molle]|uniref:Uncharacterized protein n=1 Tax=Rhododendron molle TaxID=49168 RepID=A0ACC0MLV3_RHOML|nr:hypothetical protein RHMOL_Rhmol08G0061800 [Rhododendron molle]